jgi:hypothetical protein
MNKKVSVPRKVNYKGVPHELAYVTKKEMSLMRKHGGSGEPGVGGIPTFIPDDGNRGADKTGRDFDRASSGGSKGEFGGGDSKDAGNFSNKNFDKAAANKGIGQSQASLENQAEKARQDRISKALDIIAGKKKQPSVNALIPGGILANVGNKLMRSLMEDQLKGKKLVDAIFDDDGEYLGNVTKNALGMNVYTGKQKVGYKGKFQNLVEQQTPGDSNDKIEENIVKEYGGGNIDPNKQDGVNQVLPDAPTEGELGEGDLADEAKKKMGQTEQINTTPQGLLTKARTRRRSLLATGLLT